PVSSDVRLFYKGKDIPFQLSDGSDSLFGPGDALEFFGTPLRDSGLVLNEYSDTSMFWILFNQAGGLRSASDTVVVPVPDDTVRSFPVTVRMERDSFYFFGNGGILINNQSGKAPGEGWYWKKLLANQTGTVAFTSRNLFTSGNPSYEIRGRLHSPVTNEAMPNHEAEVRLNNTLIGVIQFAGLKDTLFTLAAPAILFNEGENSISIVSKPTAAPVNEIYLDWIEVSTQHELFADNDTLLFNAGTSQAGVVALFQLGGFSSPDISVYRIGPNGGVEKSFRGALQGTGPYSLSFTDTVTAGRNYIALTQARKSVPLSLEKKTFANLRSSSRGTDYLVITSNELVTEANRLATYRSQQGLGRAEVVLVKDIYDEFNFGHFDPFAIRRFLLAIDTLWTTPAPAFVVLFGDASWDYKDHLKGGRRNLVPSLGNPVSDAWLVSAPNDIFLATKKVGRIPARSAAEAATFVDMLLEYETLPLSAWNKRFLFLASGFDSVETARFRNFSESLISQRITP
ncbi:MAG: C25 family cysteine peptidase, partial [Bacteroidota bacterium]